MQLISIFLLMEVRKNFDRSIKGEMFYLKKKRKEIQTEKAVLVFAHYLSKPDVLENNNFVYRRLSTK